MNEKFSLITDGESEAYSRCCAQRAALRQENEELKIQIKEFEQRFISVNDILKAKFREEEIKQLNADLMVELAEAKEEIKQLHDELETFRLGKHHIENIELKENNKQLREIVQLCLDRYIHLQNQNLGNSQT